MSMSIAIDGKETAFLSDDKNIIDVGLRAGIGIPDPCHRSKKLKGCCQVCVVVIDGKHEYACATKPVDGMSVVVNRPDLISLRRERLKKYREMPLESQNNCTCSPSTASNDCC
jgi:NADH dehydrogenase/NADH:ubiquinone oxidoreductase subunit G